MSDFFTTFAGSLPLWLLPLAIIVYVWGKMVRSGLNPENHASFQRTINWFREERVEQLYLSALGGLMDRVGNLIGDRHKLGVSYASTNKPAGLTTRLFGFNPFTPESYEKCLLLAFSYPIFSFLGAWMIGGDGKIGEVNFLSIRGGFVVDQENLLFGVALILVAVFYNHVLIKQSTCKRWLWLAVIISFLSWSVSLFIFDWSIFALHSIFLVFFVLVFSPLYVGGWVIGIIVYRSWQQAHISIYNTAFSFTFSFMIAIASALIVASSKVPIITSISELLAFTSVLVVAISGSVIVAVAFAIVFAFGLANIGILPEKIIVTSIVLLTIAGSLIVMLNAFKKCAGNRLTSHRYWVIYTTTLLATGACSLYYIKAGSHMVLLMFWLLLPLVNAPLDWLSLGVTRGLLQAVRSGEHSARTALVWAAMDLILALVFLFLATAVLVGVTALGNAIAQETLVDIQSILQGMKETPDSVDHWWIYFMLLSTLVPTLIHFALAGGAATLWLPRKWRLSIAEGLENDVHKTQLAWVYLTFTPVVGFIVVPAALLFSLWWLVNANGAWLGMHLLGWAQWLADTAGAL